MTRSRLTFAGLALLASAGIAQTAPGPSARDLYHRGARQFVDGEQAAALAAVDAGLAQAPGDARLQALRDLIQQQQDDQDDQDGGQQDQDAQNSEGDGEANSEAGDQGEQGDEGENGQGPQDQQDGPTSENGPEAERDQTNTAPPQSAAPGQAPPQAGQAGEMTPAQADRILDAVGGEERLLLREMRRAPTQRRRSDKDW